MVPARHDIDRRTGDACRDRRDWAGSAEAYRRYLSRRKAHVAVWIRLGNVLRELGDVTAADHAYAEAARLAPTSGTPSRVRGELWSAAGNEDLAGHYYAQAWKLDRDRLAGAALSRPAQLGRLARLQHAAQGAWGIYGAVDGLRDLAIEGWAWNPAAPGLPATVVLAAGGREVCRVVADVPRPDLAALGLAPNRCGFRIDVAELLSNGLATELDLRIADSDTILAGSPVDLSDMRGLQRWLTRPWPQPGGSGPPLISIITPVHDVRVDWFEQLVASVLAQEDGRWAWIVADDGSQSPALVDLLETLANRDPRITVIRSVVSRGTAAATNLALREAHTDYVLFVDHDDVLEPEAVSRLVTGIEAGGDLIYGDEVVTGPDIRDLRLVVARPAFSWRYYLSHPYFVHPVCVRRSLVGTGLNEALPVSADVDFVLRILENAEQVVHVPGVIYRWRSHAGSASQRHSAAVIDCSLQALNRHFTRLGLAAKPAPGPVFNTFRIDFEDPGGRVLVIIPTKNRGDLLRLCIDSILATTTRADVDIVVIDHQSDEPDLAAYLESLSDTVRVMPFEGPFNFSRMNNQAVERFGASHDFVLFLNNDVEALEVGWLSRMRALAAMRDVGAVGATLLYPDGRIQHAGVVIGPGGYAEHAMKFVPFLRQDHRNPGYNCALTAIRDWSAVTAACLMTRIEVFRSVGGFDETFAVGFNDTDLCLRIKARGLNVVVDGWAALRHHESATRRTTGGTSHPEDAERFSARWQPILKTGDPFYNPILSLDRDHHPEHLDTDRLLPRMVKLDLHTARP